MKRYEVLTTWYHPLDNVCWPGHHVVVTQYRWRWLARYICWTTNMFGSPLPLLSGVPFARWRPILRVVPARRAA